MKTDKQYFFGILLACSVGFLCYINTFKAQFAYDDNRAILENIDILPKTPWWNIWHNDFWGTPLSHSGSHKSYRPLTVLSFRLNYIAGELNPSGYHFINVVLHSFATGLVFVLAYSLFASIFQSLFASLLFAVHPIHTEAVSGIVGRADVLSCIFFILSFISYTKSTNDATIYSSPHISTRWRYIALSILFSVAAMLCKEIGITVLAVCIVYDVIFITEPHLGRLEETFWRAKTRGSWTRIFCLLLAAGLAVYWRLVIMDLSVPAFNVSDNPASVDPRFEVRFLTFSYLPVKNLYLLLFPWQLSFDWSMDAVQLITSFTDTRNLEILLFYSFIVVVGIKFVKCLSGQDYDDSSCNNSCTNSDSSTSSETIKRKLREERRTTSHEKNSKAPNTFVSNLGFKLNCLISNCSGSSSHNPKNGFVRNGLDRPCNGFQDVNASARPTQRNGLKQIMETSTCMENLAGNNNKAKQILSEGRYATRNGTCRKQSSGRSINGILEKYDNTNNHHNHFLEKSEVRKMFDQCLNLNQSFKLAVFSLVIMVISFLPASNLFFYVGFVIAERVLYIPSIGFCLLVAIGFGHIWNTNQRWRPALVASCVFLLGLFAIRTIVRNEDWRNEESLYRSGVHVNPAKAWGNLGSVLSKQGKSEEAEQAFRNAIQVRPNMADAHYNLGILLQNTQRFNESIECYRNAINYRPQLASAYLNLGLVYEQLGQKSQALKILQGGRNLSDQGLKDPRAHHHSLTSIRYNIGKIFFDMGKFQESIATFLEAVDKMPDSYAPHSLYNMLGQSHSFLGDKDNAELWYMKALKSNNSHVPAHLTYARHLASIGDSKKAELWFSKALKLQPSNSESYYLYAEFLHNNNRFSEASTQIEKAIDLNPNDINLITFAASCFREAKMHPKAEKYYRRAVSLNPNESGYHMNLGAFLHLTGRLDEAKISYMEAIKLNPGDQLTLENLRKLESLLLKRKDNE